MPSLRERHLINFYGMQMIAYFPTMKNISITFVVVVVAVICFFFIIIANQFARLISKIQIRAIIKEAQFLVQVSLSLTLGVLKHTAFTCYLT